MQVNTVANSSHKKFNINIEWFSKKSRELYFRWLFTLSIYVVLENYFSYSFQILKNMEYRVTDINVVFIYRMYPALETLIEPHRLIACMNCVVSVARAMLNAGRWYPEGKLHVLPLLNLSLPGIDPNDFKKCLVTSCSTYHTILPVLHEISEEIISYFTMFSMFFSQT